MSNQIRNRLDYLKRKGISDKPEVSESELSDLLCMPMGNEEFKFIPVGKKLPPYGAPVLIKIKNTVQHITYTLDGADDVEDWFEPYHFEHDNDMKVWWDEVDSWALMPDWRD